MNKIDQVTVKVLEGKVANLIKKISTIEKKVIRIDVANVLTYFTS